uniref:DDE Tnp4 domain-containing protein n=1 Tax=Caenorhabditis japonica TaxID=281687 RepID=A0A8R1J172_CAEJA
MSTLAVNSDAQLFRCGPLETMLENIAQTGGCRNLPHSGIPMVPFVLADNGFGLSKNVMTPFRSNQMVSSNHIRFNEKISGTRVKIENLFGILCSKFQVFGRNLRLSPENSRALIIACSVIHNITIGPLIVAHPHTIAPPLPDPYRTAEEQRSALMDYLLNNN